MKTFKCRLRAQKKEDAVAQVAASTVGGTPVRGTGSLYVVGEGKQACFIEMKSA